MATASRNDDFTEAENAALFPPEVTEATRRLFADQKRAERNFYAAQVDNLKAGRPLWEFGGDVYADDWARCSREEWFHLRHGALPDLEIRVRLAPTPDGLVCTGLHLEGAGREISARDLRKIQLRPLLAGALAGYNDILRQIHVAPARAAKPGRRGYDDAYWRSIYALYARHKARSPRRFIKAMREEYQIKDRPSEAAVRRWVKTIEAKIASGDLPPLAEGETE